MVVVCRSRSLALVFPSPSVAFPFFVYSLPSSLSLSRLFPLSPLSPLLSISKEVGEQQSPFAFHSRVELILLLFFGCYSTLPFVEIYTHLSSISPFRLLCASRLFAVVRCSSVVRHRFRFDSACSDVLALSTGSLSLTNTSLNLEGRGGGSSHVSLTRYFFENECEKSNCNCVDPGPQDFTA